ncbi:hypothetical protein ES288_D13G220500v1 [Gossypium darwinii]|uniref:Uncharacterized protein n=1 Tax=Gossypium darwinii TaxID=34276 RepID=A0A5D2A370_GOSDA|nr:hypothetical protein ES288_D13G220500v1 [Gossypium darwinii]
MLTMGEQIVCKDFKIFPMLTQDLCPPARAISFKLPSPVNNQEPTTYLENRMLEAIVKKNFKFLAYYFLTSC